MTQEMSMSDERRDATSQAVDTPHAAASLSVEAAR